MAEVKSDFSCPYCPSRSFVSAETFSLSTGVWVNLCGECFKYSQHHEETSLQYPITDPSNKLSPVPEELL